MLKAKKEGNEPPNWSVTRLLGGSLGLWISGHLPDLNNSKIESCWVLMIQPVRNYFFDLFFFSVCIMIGIQLTWFLTTITYFDEDLQYLERNPLLNWVGQVTERRPNWRRLRDSWALEVISFTQSITNVNAKLTQSIGLKIWVRNDGKLLFSPNNHQVMNNQPIH